MGSATRPAYPSPTEAEIRYGIELLPSGKRRTLLRQAAAQMFAHDFAGRILSFDSPAAQAFAEIVSRRAAAGRPISNFDALIAAIASAREATLATRNVRDFDLCGLDDVSDQIEIFGGMFPQKINQTISLTGAGSKMEVGNKNAAYFGHDARR